MGDNLCGVVLIVDGDEVCRAQLDHALSRAGYQVCSFASGIEALAAAAQHTPAIVLSELELSDVSGYELCRQLRNAHGDGLPVFLMSGERTKAMDRVAGLMIGADDYIVKPFELDELVARVHRSIERSSHERIGPHGAALEVTPREHDVLVLLADGRDQDEIAAALHISPKTVATHIQHLLAKFDAHSRAQLVALAYKHGLVDRD